MKKSRKIVLIVLAVLILCSAGLYLLRAVPSEFGKKPYYNLSADQVERGEIVAGAEYFDRWRVEMSEEEIGKVCETLSQIRLNGKNDPADYEMQDDLGNGYEHFCLYLKNGKTIRVAYEGKYFYKNFVRYEVNSGSVEICRELSRYHEQLLLKTGYYRAIQSLQ